MKQLQCDIIIVGGGLSGLLGAYALSFTNQNLIIIDKNEVLEESVNKIYSERKKIYNKSDFKIKCNLMNADQIVSKIIKLYESSENKI